MVNHSEMTLTNKISFQLDEVGFDQRYRLLLVETLAPQKLTDWFNACPILAMHRLRRHVNFQTKKSDGPYRYLAMVDRQINLPRLDAIHVTPVRVRQALQQGITSDTIVFMMLKQLTQCRIENNVLGNYDAVSDLYLTLSHGYKKQKHTLVVIEVKLDNRVLRLISRTFTEVSKKGYVISGDCLKWSNGGPGPFFKKASHNGIKNLTTFLSLQDFQKFNNSKAGIAYRLMTQLRERYLDCFKIAPSFCAYPVQNYTGRLKTTAEQQALKMLANRSLNIVTASSDDKVQNMVNYLVAQLERSPRLQKNRTIITTSSKPKPGLNIQVVQDLADPVYLMGSATTIIQHVTVNNFGQSDENFQFQWRVKSGQDIWDDPRFRTTIYQLGVKQDVYCHQLNFPSDVEAQFAAKYRYFDFHELDEQTVQVTYLDISADRRQLNFKRLRLNMGQHNEPTTEIEQAAYAIWQCPDENPKLLLGGLQVDNQLFAIYRSDLETVPDLSKIKTALVAANQSDYVNLADLKLVAQDVLLENKKDVLHKQQLIADLQRIPTGRLTIAELRQSISQNWRSNVMKRFADDYHTSYDKWLYLPIRRKQFDAYWVGMYGSGLLNIAGDAYYFVGQQQQLDVKVSRAVPLKKLVSVNSHQSVTESQLAFDVLANLMQVGFVRYNQYTVLPFPFKYIREYNDILKHRDKRGLPN